MLRDVVASSFVIRHSSLVILCACLATRAHGERLETARLPVAELLAQKPLAECAVQSLGGQSQPAEMRPNVVMMGTALTADPLDNYARSRDGEWQIPTASAGDDPWVRLLLLPPDRPLVVDVAVTVDGRSYRLVREKWMELLLSQAKGKYSTDEESTEPAAELPAGTSPESLASEKATDGTPDPNSKDAESKPVGVKAESRKVPTVIERLKNYVATAGDEVDPEEIRWLLADWTGGPELVVLGPAASWQRAEAAPLWSWLDVDGDHNLSAAEVVGAPERLREADVDEDGIVDLSELYRSDKLASPYEKQFTHPLVVVIDNDTDWYALLDDLADVYGGEYASMSANDLEKLRDQAPDLVCRASLNAKDGKMAVLSAGERLGDAAEVVTAAENVITADLGCSYLELCAANSSSKDSGELTTPQIGIGAVVDGFPLLRLLDADGDTRITSPEQRQLAELLSGLDRDGDGALQQSEIPTAIRLAVTQGPHVHELLRERNRAAELRTKERLPVPSWFSDMDRNRDGELSRREFLGTSAQFDQLDRDGNDLIGDREVQESAPAGEPP